MHYIKTQVQVDRFPLIKMTKYSTKSQKTWNKYKITEIVHMHKRATRQNLPVFPYKVAVFFISNGPKVVTLLVPASSIGFKVQV